VLLVSGDFARRTGGNLYDRRMQRASRHAGVPLRTISVASTAQARATLARLEPSVVVIDSIALSIAAPLVPWIHEDLRARVVALMHMPTAARGARGALRAADRVVAVSPALGRALAHAGVSRSRLAVIPPGSDGILKIARGKRRAQGGGLRVLAVANWSASKGIATLVSAVARVPGLHLDLVGDAGTGVYRDRVRALVRSHGLAARVTIHGSLDGRALARRYADADVFALPSEREGYGIVFSEALMQGLPVIAADIATVRAIVGDAGLFVPPRRVRPLAAALRLMTDGWLRRRLAKVARIRSRELPRWTTSERSFVALLRREMNAAVARS
jgi:glycosyltransferase involved in cell wall biosynthesis